MENGRYQGVLARNRSSKKSKVLTAIQVLSIIVALILSSYALVLLNGLQLSQGKDGQDAIETLVLSEGREADSICTEGGSDIFIGTDTNRNGVLDECRNILRLQKFAMEKKGFRDRRVRMEAQVNSAVMGHLV